MQFTPFVLPLIFSALILFGLSLFALRQPKNAAAYAFLVVVFSSLLWTVGYIFELLSIDLQAKIILANVQYIGIEFGTAAWLIMTIAMLGYSKVLKRLVPTLLVVPIINTVVIWTDHLHHFFRGNPYLDNTSGIFTLLVNDYGVWYYFIQMPYIYLCFLTSISLLAWSLKLAKGTYRFQIIMALLSLTFPLILNLLYMLDLSPIRYFNYSTLGLSLSALVIGWNLYHYRFLDLMPVARSMLVEMLGDGWMVLDQNSRIVDLNAAACRILAKDISKIIGHLVEEVLNDKPELLSHCYATTQTHTEVEVIQKNVKTYYDFNLTPFYDVNHQLIGRLIVFHDVTLRVEMEHEREDLIKELQQALIEVRLLSGLLPLCAGCKKVRDDKGYWHQVEAYFEEHSDVRFSHGYCPSCLRKLYPDIAEDIISNVKGHMVEVEHHDH